MSSWSDDDIDPDLNPDFCPDAFFDAKVSWDTENPNLSSCLRDTVLSATPLLVLAVSLLIQTLIRRNSRFNGRSQASFPQRSVWHRFSTLFWIKAILTVVLAGNAAGELIYRGNLAGWSELFPSDWFGPTCLLLSNLLALATLTWDSAVRRRHTSPPLFLYWSTMLLLASPTFKVQVEELLDDVKWESVALTSTFYPVICLVFLANCWPDLSVLTLPPKGSLERKKVPPEYVASFLSISVFSWLDSLVYQGYKKPLVQEQLPDPPDKVGHSTNVLVL